jgi:hypothetical protein
MIFSTGYLPCNFDMLSKKFFCLIFRAKFYWMKIHFKKLSFFLVFLSVVVACSDTRREPDKSQATESDTVKNYNPPAHVIKGGDSLSPDTANKR